MIGVGARPVAWAQAMSRLVVVLAVGLGASACASLPPASPVPGNDFASISGAWEGRGPYGRYQDADAYPVRTRIWPDGRYQRTIAAERYGGSIEGRLTLVSGIVSFDDAYASGSLTYHASDDRRYLKWAGAAKDGGGEVSVIQAPLQPYFDYDYEIPMSVAESDRRECSELADAEAKRRLERMGTAGGSAGLVGALIEVAVRTVTADNVFQERAIACLRDRGYAILET